MISSVITYWGVNGAFVINIFFAYVIKVILLVKNCLIVILLKTTFKMIKMLSKYDTLYTSILKKTLCKIELLIYIPIKYNITRNIFQSIITGFPKRVNHNFAANFLNA